MSAADILNLGLVPLARAIRQGEVTSRAATEAVLEALAERAPALNALARLHAEEALAEADACDRERAKGRLRGPLHGVPMAHKDMFHRRGRISEMGTTIFRGHVADTTATAIEKLDAAGAIDIGRLNMVEFALGVTGHNRHTGHPRNAWNPAYITGGSTSGGATSVAARLSPATLGSDTGGSIRVPAALCGIVGIKGTYGRVSRAGAMPLSFSLDTIGPLCRSAEDAALFLEVISGFDPKDRTTSLRPVPRWSETLGGGIEGLRVALPRDCFEHPIHPEIQALWDEAAQVLRGLGAVVEERRLPQFAAYNSLRRAIFLGDVATLHRDLVRTRRADYNETTLSRMLPGYALPTEDYLRAVNARSTLLARFCREVFADIDLLALPTTPVPTPTIAETDTDGDPAYVETANVLGGLIGPFNYLGLPAISTPMGFDGHGLPVGLQLASRPFTEDVILRAADCFERATGWAARRPPGA